MESQKLCKALKWFVLLAFLAMLTVNALSSILPINGVTPKEVSDRYPNLFVPAPLTFAIWGVIYLLVMGYVLYVLGAFHRRGETCNTTLLNRTGIVFIITRTIVFLMMWTAIILSLWRWACPPLASIHFLTS